MVGGGLRAGTIRDLTCPEREVRWVRSIPGLAGHVERFSLYLLLSCFSRARLCETPEAAAHQAPPSLGFSRQEHWSGLPFPSPMRESEVAQSCPTLSDPMDCSLPGSSVHGIFQASLYLEEPNSLPQGTGAEKLFKPELMSFPTKREKIKSMLNPLLKGNRTAGVGAAREKERYLSIELFLLMQ